MHALECVLQRWAVVLLEHVRSHLDEVVGPDPEDLGGKRSVMDGAHRDPLRHDGLAAVGVLLDVGRVEQLRVLQATQGAAAAVRDQHPVPEHSLVETLADDHLGIAPTGREVGGMGKQIAHRLPLLPHSVIERHDELVLGGLLTHEMHRVDGVELTGPDPVNQMSGVRCSIATLRPRLPAILG